MRLRGSVQIEHTLARLGAEKLWKLVNTEPYVNCLGALTGGQAMQQVKAGLKAIYLSGWQVAADNNSYMTMYPDQSLYPVNSVPAVVERINATFKRADEIQCARGIAPGSPDYVDYFAPIVADAEAGFGGVLNAFELMKAMIRAGAARRAFRGPARRGQEVRSHGRQGAGADAGSRAEADRRTARGRRHGRADHRCSRAPMPKRPTC